jgi:hypothetical protein
MRPTPVIGLILLFSATASFSGCGQDSPTSSTTGGQQGGTGGTATAGTSGAGTAGAAAGGQGGAGPSGETSGSAGAAGTPGTGGTGGTDTGAAGKAGTGGTNTGAAGKAGTGGTNTGAAGKGGTGGTNTGAAGKAGTGGTNTGAAGSAGSSTGGSSGTGGAPASSCTKANAACVASNTGCNVSGYYLYDNQWNCGPSSGNHCGPESAYGCANADGSVSFVTTSNQPAGNTAVLTYPAAQKNFNAKPALSSFKSIVSTFSEKSPGVGDYEVAWDCWFNDNANEFMIWVDNFNQVPAGKKVATGVMLGGHSWDVWWAASSGYLVFNATKTITSATIDLLELFKYATTNGWLPAASTVDQLDFGIEVCSTGGKDATWTIDNYSLTTN